MVQPTRLVHITILIILVFTQETKCRAVGDDTNNEGAATVRITVHESIEKSTVVTEPNQTDEPKFKNEFTLKPNEIKDVESTVTEPTTESDAISDEPESRIAFKDEEPKPEDNEQRQNATHNADVPENKGAFDSDSEDNEEDRLSAETEMPSTTTDPNDPEGRGLFVSKIKHTVKNTMKSSRKTKHTSKNVAMTGLNGGGLLQGGSGLSGMLQNTHLLGSNTEFANQHHSALNYGLSGVSSGYGGANSLHSVNQENMLLNTAALNSGNTIHESILPGGIISSENSGLAGGAFLPTGDQAQIGYPPQVITQQIAPGIIKHSTQKSHHLIGGLEQSDNILIGNGYQLHPAVGNEQIGIAGISANEHTGVHSDENHFMSHGAAEILGGQELIGNTYQVHPSISHGQIGIPGTGQQSIITPVIVQESSSQIISHAEHNVPADISIGSAQPQGTYQIQPQISTAQMRPSSLKHSIKIERKKKTKRCNLTELLIKLRQEMAAHAVQAKPISTANDMPTLLTNIESQLPNDSEGSHLLNNIKTILLENPQPESISYESQVPVFSVKNPVLEEYHPKMIPSPEIIHLQPNSNEMELIPHVIDQTNAINNIHAMAIPNNQNMHVLIEEQPTQDMHDIHVDHNQPEMVPMEPIYHVENIPISVGHEQKTEEIVIPQSPIPQPDIWIPHQEESQPISVMLPEIPQPEVDSNIYVQPDIINMPQYEQPQLIQIPQHEEPNLIHLPQHEPELIQMPQYQQPVVIHLPHEQPETMDIPQHEEPDLIQMPQYEQPESIQVPQYEQPEIIQVPQYEQHELIQVPQYEQPEFMQVPQYEQPEIVQIHQNEETDTIHVPQHEHPVIQVPQYEQPNLIQVPQYEIPDIIQMPQHEEPEYEQPEIIHIPQYEQHEMNNVPQYQQPEIIYMPQNEQLEPIQVPQYEQPEMINVPQYQQPEIIYMPQYEQPEFIEVPHYKQPEEPQLINLPQYEEPELIQVLQQEEPARPVQIEHLVPEYPQGDMIQPNLPNIVYSETADHVQPILPNIVEEQPWYQEPLIIPQVVETPNQFEIQHELMYQPVITPEVTETPYLFGIQPNFPSIFKEKPFYLEQPMHQIPMSEPELVQVPNQFEPQPFIPDNVHEPMLQIPILVPEEFDIQSLYPTIGNEQPMYQVPEVQPDVEEGPEYHIPITTIIHSSNEGNIEIFPTIVEQNPWYPQLLPHPIGTMLQPTQNIPNIDQFRLYTTEEENPQPEFVHLSPTVVYKESNRLSENIIPELDISESDESYEVTCAALEPDDISNVQEILKMMLAKSKNRRFPANNLKLTAIEILKQISCRRTKQNLQHAPIRDYETPDQISAMPLLNEFKDLISLLTTQRLSYPTVELLEKLIAFLTNFIRFLTNVIKRQSFGLPDTNFGPWDQLGYLHPSQTPPSYLPIMNLLSSLPQMQTTYEKPPTYPIQLLNLLSNFQENNYRPEASIPQGNTFNNLIYNLAHSQLKPDIRPKFPEILNLLSEYLRNGNRPQASVPEFLGPLSQYFPVQPDMFKLQTPEFGRPNAPNGQIPFDFMNAPPRLPEWSSPTPGFEGTWPDDFEITPADVMGCAFFGVIKQKYPNIDDYQLANFIVLTIKQYLRHTINYNYFQGISPGFGNDVPFNFGTSSNLHDSSNFIGEPMRAYLQQSVPSAVDNMKIDPNYRNSNLYNWLVQNYKSLSPYLTQVNK